jgi:hypothetical protein
MPSISDALKVGLEGYEPAMPKTPSVSSTMDQQPVPVRNPFLRCPLPQIWQTNTDSLRQTFTTVVPQRRLFIPK